MLLPRKTRSSVEAAGSLPYSTTNIVVITPLEVARDADSNAIDKASAAVTADDVMPWDEEGNDSHIEAGELGKNIKREEQDTPEPAGDEQGNADATMDTEIPKQNKERKRKRTASPSDDPTPRKIGTISYSELKTLPTGLESKGFPIMSVVEFSKTADDNEPIREDKGHTSPARRGRPPKLSGRRSSDSESSPKKGTPSSSKGGGKGKVLGRSCSRSERTELQSMDAEESKNSSTETETNNLRKGDDKGKTPAKRGRKPKNVTEVLSSIEGSETKRAPKKKVSRGDSSARDRKSLPASPAGRKKKASETVKPEHDSPKNSPGGDAFVQLSRSRRSVQKPTWLKEYE